ncbi:MAG: hypothetical protein Q8O28_11345 [Smithellaceae bacterium]|nr:hypothetical protein [Smithellaceae bacterium]
MHLLLGTVKTALPLEELPFLLVENPIKITHGASSSDLFPVRQRCRPIKNGAQIRQKVSDKYCLPSLLGKDGGNTIDKIAVISWRYFTFSQAL